MAERGDDVPTFPVTAPDGETIHVPYFPGLGEAHHASHPRLPTPPPPLPKHVTPAAPAQHRIPSPPHAPSHPSIGQQVSHLAHSAYQFLAGDDIDTLRNLHATPLQKIGAAAALGSWLIPEGKIAETVAHATAKAAELLAAHAATSGAFHTSESALAGSAAWFLRKSDIWQRPLTSAEREGRFATHEDFAAFMGPAGDGKEWHHIVERNKEAQFGAERIHSVENYAAIKAKPEHRGISSYFQSGNALDFGVDADERALSPRRYLEGRSWEENRQHGDNVLRKFGLNPAELRAETLQRFEQRLQEHDRPFGPHREPGMRPRPLRGRSGGRSR